MEFNEKKFYIPKKRITNKFLEQNNFRYSKTFSDNTDSIYIYRFNVWRYGNAGILEGEIMLNSSTGELNVGCYDYGTRYAYASWYCRKYGKNEIVDIIDEKIQNELNKIGARTHDK